MRSHNSRTWSMAHLNFILASVSTNMGLVRAGPAAAGSLQSLMHLKAGTLKSILEYREKAERGEGEGGTLYKAEILKLPDTIQADFEDPNAHVVWGYRWMTDKQYQAMIEKGDLLDGPPADSKKNGKNGKTHTIGYGLYLGSTATGYLAQTTRPWICSVKGPMGVFLDAPKIYVPFYAYWPQKKNWHSRTKWQAQPLFGYDHKFGLRNDDPDSHVTQWVRYVMAGAYGGQQRAAMTAAEAGETIRFSQYKPSLFSYPFDNFLQIVLPPSWVRDIDVKKQIRCSQDPNEVDEGDVGYNVLRGFNTAKGFFFGEADFES